jgi:ornithine decarboxylase
MDRLPVTFFGRLSRGGSAVALDRFIEELEQHGLRVDCVAGDLGDSDAVGLSRESQVALVGWGDPLDRPIETIEAIERVLPDTAIVMISDSPRVDEVPLRLAERARGFFWIGEDTPQFVAGRITRLAGVPAAALPEEQVELPPFFGAVKRYTEDYNWNWSCPGHQGGRFYQKTPLGRAYLDFMGENALRADLCNASVELGSLMHHEGPIAEAERRAADVFGAERTYFVLNGTSTSNKMVLLALLSPGDLVLFDRNCHKSMHHSLMISGAVPVYLNSTRGASGLIGPVDHRWLQEDHIRDMIRNNPLVDDSGRGELARPFRLAVLTNSTYDGICYDAQEVLTLLGGLCDHVVFDEAWLAHAKFHPLYRGRFAMDLEPLGDADPGVYATQSTHKCLAGLSQCSQIHVRDSHLADQSRRVEHDRFNEVFMMHTSTSPQYNMIASLDVGAELMRGEQGVALIDDAIREAIALRRQITNFARDLTNGGRGSGADWFFGMFGPSEVTVTAGQLESAMSDPRLGGSVRESLRRAAASGGISHVPWTELSDDILANVAGCWQLNEGDDWHDLTGLAPGYSMLDPTKCTITTPGVRQDGATESWGIPAAVPAAILRARGTVTEKTSFYTMLVLVTAAIERGKSASLLSDLLEIKRLYDGEAPLAEVLPAVVAPHPDRYGALSLPDLCTEMHETLRALDAAILQRAAFSVEQAPEIAISPASAHAQRVAGGVELVPLASAAGRIAANLIVAYPPGIGVIVPGERFGADSAAIAYLSMFEELDNRFPGLESEIQGVYRRPDERGILRYFTYVTTEAA